MRRPEPTKEKVERAALSITVIKFPIRLDSFFYWLAATNSSLGMCVA